MNRIMSSLSADAVVSLLKENIIRELSFFINLESAGAVFDHLWDHDDAFHFVITDSRDFEWQELYAAAQKRPETQFILVGLYEEPPEERADNVVFIDSPQTLNESVASRTRL